MLFQCISHFDALENLQMWEAVRKRRSNMMQGTDITALETLYYPPLCIIGDCEKLVFTMNDSLGWMTYCGQRG